MEKITKREMYEAIIEAVEKGEWKFNPEDVIDFCKNEISLLDKKAAKAKETAAKKKVENDTLTDMVYEVLTDEFQPIADIAAKIDNPDITVAKITYRLRVLVERGMAEKEQISIPAVSEGSKARKIMAYRKVN